MKITRTGDYESSKEVVEGKKRAILTYMRSEALRMRKESRMTMPKELRDVHSIIGADRHISEVVNLASFQINQMNIEQLLPLINAHGVMSYSISEQ